MEKLKVIGIWIRLSTENQVGGGKPGWHCLNTLHFLSVILDGKTVPAFEQLQTGVNNIRIIKNATILHNLFKSCTNAQGRPAA
jgi:hypothetical protein